MAEHTPDRIIDRRELLELIPFSAVHILRLERAGKFPVRIRLGQNRVGWMLSEITAWIAGRKADRHRSPPSLPAPKPLRYARRQPS